MARKHYGSDATDGQWQIIEPLLPPPSTVGRPRTLERRDVIDAIFYLEKTGCQWRMLPGDFPHWKTVYNLFWEWRGTGLWQRIHDALRQACRGAEGKEPSPSAAVIDSQSVATTQLGGERGYDAGKKTKGRKRHLVVDTLGLILAVVVHEAGVQDQDGARLVLARLRGCVGRLQLIWGDSAYGRNGLPEWVKLTFGWLVQTVLRPVGVAGFVVLPKRWIVERTFAWLNLSRRHSKDYERNPESSEAMILITMIRHMSRRLAKHKIQAA